MKNRFDAADICLILFGLTIFIIPIGLISLKMAGVSQMTPEAVTMVKEIVIALIGAVSTAIGFKYGKRSENEKQDNKMEREIWVYEIEMFKNIGTIEVPNMQWITEKRFYYGEKQLTDSDLHDIPGLRRNAKFIEKINQKTNE